jgi:SAM-dependent methyltransferase
MRQVMSQVAERLETYLASEINCDILESDEMFTRGVPGAMEHYFHVGRSAINVIAQAMIVTGRTSFETVLDLPCGGGRVTRHLTEFFPDATLYVADLDKQKEAFVERVFGVTALSVTSDFSVDPEHRFDLIFIGSLLTHLNAAAFERAVEWLIKAVADDGLLVLTTHGRRHDFAERMMHRAPHWVRRSDRFFCRNETESFRSFPRIGLS